MSPSTSPLLPLSDFTKLTDGQYWYKPPGRQSSTNSLSSPSTTPIPQPDLIIFCTWAFAAPKHFSKYIVQYQHVYPQSQILLLQSSLANLAWTPDKVQMHRLTPTVEAIRNFQGGNSRINNNGAERSGSYDPVILVHAFSNGGAHSLVQLAQAYRESIPTASESDHAVSSDLSISAMILDSSPGKVDFDTGVKVVLSPFAKTALLSRLLFTPVAYMLIAGVKSAHYLGIAEHIASKLWRCLNDMNGSFLVKSTSSIGKDEGGGIIVAREGFKIIPRTYIYSTGDEMVAWQNVEEHAEEAKQAVVTALGKTTSGMANVEDVIRLECFSGSPHVNHVLVDSQRYWRVVQETVERAC